MGLVSRSALRLSLWLCFLFLSASAASAAVTFDDIPYWVGSGPNRAALVIDFNDNKAPESLVWGYRWSGAASGEDMFAAVVAADPQLFAKRKTFSFGPANLGIGYDADADGFSISDGTTFDPATGIAQGNENQADGATPVDPQDHYREGWFSGYFAYYTANDNPYLGGAWASSQVGGKDRPLVDGAWDGLSFAPNFVESAPNEPFPVPEPGAAAVLAAGMLLIAARSRRARTKRTSVTCAIALLSVCASTSRAASYAVEVVDYEPGGIRTDYRIAGSSLGPIGPFTGTSPFQVTPLVVTPFNAPWTPSEITGIGASGKLVLRLGQAAQTGNGFTLGVHAGVNLGNVGGPEGQASNPAATFNHRRADVRVSFDGQNWVPLAADVLFNVSTNYFSAGVTTPAAQATAGTIEADLTRPFTVIDGGARRAGRLADFDGLSYPQMLSLLDNSAGGTWFDLTEVPLPGVNYVEFTVGADDQQMYVDSVVAIPEPVGVLLLGVAASVVITRRRRPG